jgi:two-component system CheB/CheR fusion protein
MAVALKEDRAIRGAEAIAERPDGTRVPFIPYPTPLHDGSGKLIGAVNMLVDISERKRAEEQQSLLVREMEHRIKNIFAVVRGIVSLSARADGTTRDMAGAIRGRLDALARAHDLTRPGLISREADARAPATLHTLIRTIFSPHVGEEGSERAGRVIVTGPDVAIGGQAVTSLALLFHELTTNATKYGPLSCAAGHVEIGCSLEQGDLVVSWKEHGGPPLSGPPAHEGFGTALARRVVRSQFGGRLSQDWKPEGLTIRLSVPVGRLTE